MIGQELNLVVTGRGSALPPARKSRLPIEWTRQSAEPRVRTELLGGSRTLVLRGKFVLGNGDALLRRVIFDSLGSPSASLELDLGQVSFLDSAALGEIAEGTIQATRKGGALTLVNVPPALRQIVAIARLHHLLELATDRAAA